MGSSPVGPVPTCLGHCAGNWHGVLDVLRSLQNDPNETGSRMPSQMTMTTWEWLEKIISVVKRFLETLTKAKLLDCPVSIEAQRIVLVVLPGRLFVVDSLRW